MKICYTTKPNIFQIDQLNILTQDIKRIACKTITIHLDKPIDNAEEIAQAVSWWFYWMGQIYFSRDIMSSTRDIMSSTSYEGAIRRAVNEELVKDGITCTRLHIAEKQILH